MAAHWLDIAFLTDVACEVGWPVAFPHLTIHCSGHLTVEQVNSWLIECLFFSVLNNFMAMMMMWLHCSCGAWSGPACFLLVMLAPQMQKLQKQTMEAQNLCPTGSTSVQLCVALVEPFCLLLAHCNACTTDAKTAEANSGCSKFVSPHSVAEGCCKEKHQAASSTKQQRCSLQTGLLMCANKNAAFIRI